MSDALSVQEGGNHYKRMKIQPLVYILANALPFAEGSVVKYVSRWRYKGGIEDLRKARHLLDVLIQHEEAQGAPQAAEEAPRLLGKPVLAERAERPSPAITQAFGLGAAPEGRAPVPGSRPGDPSWLTAAQEKHGPTGIPAKPAPMMDDAFDNWPFDYRPRGLAVPASPTSANGDGRLGHYPEEGDEILVYHERYGWVWRKVRMISNTMVGRRYNVSPDGSSVQILMVPQDHVMAIRTKGGRYYGSNNRVA